MLNRVDREIRKLGTIMAERKPNYTAYVVGGGMEYIRMLYDFCIDGARNAQEADFVLFTGGEDVDPQLYGQVALYKTHFNRLRDEKDIEVFNYCRDNGIPMAGICRGGQFLNVMNGGKMWQHVTNHCGNHIARVEVPPYNEGDKRRTIEVTSTHHQMMIPTDEACVLMTALKADEKISPNRHLAGKNKDDPDIEAVWYEENSCLCFQPHPEYANCPPECTDLFEDFLESYIYPAIEAKKIADASNPLPKKIKKPVLKAVPIAKLK